jgi:hypothetical protein
MQRAVAPAAAWMAEFSQISQLKQATVDTTLRRSYVVPLWPVG